MDDAELKDKMIIKEKWNPTVPWTTKLTINVKWPKRLYKNDFSQNEIWRFQLSCIKNKKISVVCVIWWTVYLTLL